MKKLELRNTKTGFGKQLQTIWEHDREPVMWGLYQKLERIPGKVTNFIDQRKIKEVRKSRYKTANDHYLLEMADGSYLELKY